MNKRTIVLSTKGNNLVGNGKEFKIPAVSAVVRAAGNKNKNVRLYIKTDGTIEAAATGAEVNTESIKLIDEYKVKTDADVKVDAEQASIMEFINNSPSIKPSMLKVSDIKWKYLVRSALRAKNILMTGSAGSGKTFAAKMLIEALKQPSFYFNLGATQDPRATLIGNTHFKKEEGTYFAESLFVKAIQTPNAIILLDEISRAHPEAWNILMTVLDQGQRYLRLDEADGSPTIKVAEGVSFIATANIGNEYTSTRVMDKALMDRFIVVEMEPLTKEEEFELLTEMYPSANSDDLEKVAEIAYMTRMEVKKEDARVSTSISTRLNVEIAGLLQDGFSMSECATVAIYPFYSDDGGLDSERTFVKQLVQKFTGEAGDEEELFGQEDTDEDKN